MRKKSKRQKAIPKQKQIAPKMWIAPSFKGLFGERDEKGDGTPSHSRFLELADIALGFKPTMPNNRKAKPVHDVVKHDPYVVQLKNLVQDKNRRS